MKGPRNEKFHKQVPQQVFKHENCQASVSGETALREANHWSKLCNMIG